MRRSATVCFLLLLMPLASADQHDDAPYDILLVLTDDGAPSSDSPEQTVLTEHVDGDRTVWRLDLDLNYTIVELRVEQAFNVSDVRQVVPEYNDSAQHPVAPHTHPHAFQVLPHADPADVAMAGPEPGVKRTPVVNITGDAGSFVYRMGLPGPGEADLVVRRDDTPPGFAVGPVTDITHFSFQVATDTDEPAIATVYRQRAEELAPVPLATPTYDLRHIFPVQGMRADSAYTVWFTFEDWAGNVARSENMTVRTLPKPDVPAPRFTDLTPAPDSTVHGPNVDVSARMLVNGSLVAHDDVRLFIDKKELHNGFSVSSGVVKATVGPLEPGLHTVSVEARTLAGGDGVARWSFVVASDDEASAPAALWLLLIVPAAAWAWRARR